MSVTVATVVTGLRVATVVVTVDVLAVLVDVILGRGNALEQKVLAGLCPVRTAATTAGTPPLQNGLPAATMGARAAKRPQMSSLTPSMTCKVVIKVSGMDNDDRCW